MKLIFVNSVRLESYESQSLADSMNKNDTE